MLMKSLYASSLCVAAGGFVFLFHKGIPIPFHPLQRTEKVPPEDRESLRAWLMMARDVMHRDVGPYYRTMEAGAILDLIAGLLSSAGIKNQLCEDVAACYPGTSS